LRLQRLYKGALTKPAARTVLVPVPTQTGRIGSPALRDKPLLAWAADLLSAILGDDIATAAGVAAKR
jgi:transcription-repair coupling factor (superfamily II helicase)